MNASKFFASSADDEEAGAQDSLGELLKQNAMQVCLPGQLHEMANCASMST